MSGQDVGVVVSAAWLMGAYTTALVAAFHLAGRRQPHPQPVQAVQSLRLMPPEEMLATFNRSLEANWRNHAMLEALATKEKENNS